jgi:hypothetical protein
MCVYRALNHLLSTDEGLSSQLILHTGRISAVQRALTESTFALLSGIPSTSAFHSPVLANSLNQLSSSPSYNLTPSTLTTPIHVRHNQLATFTTNRLHVAAQHAVLATLGSLAVGAGFSWSGWVGWFVPAMDAGTAVGGGMLVALLGVRVAIGRWEKAKQRWWEDWTRVGEGLGRDLKVPLLGTTNTPFYSFWSNFIIECPGQDNGRAGRDRCRARSKWY